MSRELSAAQAEIVEEELVEYFAFMQDEVAAQLGIERQPDGLWSHEDADRIMAEINRTKRPLLESRFTETDPPATS